MDKRIALWGIIALLFVATLFLTFKAGASGNVAAAQVASSTVKSVAYGGMVGGC